MRRRTFLQLAGASALAAQVPPAGIKLGFDVYSIRAFEWKAIQLIDYAAGLGLDTIQISSLEDYESLEPAYLARVKAHADQKGLALDGGIGCICSSSTGWSSKYGTPEEYLRKGMRVAKAIGAHSMRCYLGSSADRRTSMPIEGHIENTVRALRAVRSEALDLGIKIAIENHSGDMTARETKGLIEAAGQDFVGSNLDTGNPMWVMEDPLLTLEVLGPHVLTTHIRDSAIYAHPRGAAFQWVALGDGQIDFPKFVAMFRQACPHAAIQLEIITGRPPQILPYLEADFWKAFPKMPAADFRRFLSLVRHGHPYEGPMMIGGTGKQPPEYEAALKEQQRVDLERSLTYAKTKLGLGVRKA
jgi:3-oxoisoapionate decarboxylase